MKAPLERIEAAVTWYNALKPDYNDVDTLILASNRFACAIFEFSREVGELYTEKNGAEFRRKSAFTVSRAMHLKTQEKTSYSAADSAAEVDVIEQRKEEQLADSQYMSARLMLESAKDVLDRMNQYISYLKQEKRLETSGQGSQQ